MIERVSSSNPIMVFNVLKLVAVAWMILSAYTFRSVTQWWVGALFMFFGVLTLRLSLRATDYKASDQWGRGVTFAPVGFNLPLLVVGVVCLAVVAVVAGHNIITIALNTHVQYLLWCAGLIFLSIGFLNWRGELPSVRFSRLIPLLPIVLVTGVAFVLRVWRLDSAVHYFVDEMNFARAVWAVQYGGSVPLAAPFSDITAFTWVYPYWQWLTAQFYGFDLMALRVISAVIGTLTVAGVYALAVELFDRRIAWTAALLLAVFPPHMHFSRIGINNVADPFFGVLMLAFLVRGLKYQKQRDYVLAGVMLGLTQYFYEGGRVVFPLLLLFWLEIMALTRRVRMDKPVARRVGLMMLIAIVIALPVYYTLVMQQHAMLHRFEVEGVGGSYYQALRENDQAQSLESHLTWPFLIYVKMPDLSLFYGGEAPLVLASVVPFLLAGFGVALWRMRHPAMLLLLLWVVGTSAGSVFLVTSGFSARFVVAFPAVVMLIAVGLWCAVDALGQLITTGADEQVIALRPYVVTGLVMFIAVMLGAVQVQYYFGAHLDVYNNRQLRRDFDPQDAIFRAQYFAEGTEICFVTNQPLDETFLYEMRDYLHMPMDLCFMEPHRVDAQLAQVVRPGKVVAFFIKPDDLLTLAKLRQMTPLDGPFFSPFATIPPERQFALYHNARYAGDF